MNTEKPSIILDKAKKRTPIKPAAFCVILRVLLFIYGKVGDLWVGRLEFHVAQRKVFLVFESLGILVAL